MVEIIKEEDRLIDITCSRSFNTVLSYIVLVFYWILIVMIIYFSYKTLRYLKTYCYNEQDKKCELRKNLCRRIFNYPIIIFVCFGFYTCHKIYKNWLLTQDNLDVQEYLIRFELILMLISGILTNIRGFLFFIVFGCQNNVKAELVIFYNYFLRKKDSENLILIE